MLNMKNMNKTRGFPDGVVVKEKKNMKKLGDSQVGTPANTGAQERGSFHLWVKTIPWRRKWQPASVFLLENPMDRGTWQAIVDGVAKSWIQLNN